MMRVLATLRSFVRGLTRRTALERDLAAEVQFHLAQRAEDLVRRRGLSPDEALRVARLEFGSVERYKEEARQSLGLRLMDELRSDLRYAARSLARNKVFTAAAVATLALGIGANTAMFSLMDAIVSRPLPVEQPDELMVLRITRPKRDPSPTVTNALWEAVRDHQDVFARAFASSLPWPFDFAAGEVARTIDGVMVSGDYFTTLGIAPAAGRLLAATDDRRGCESVAVLSHRFWQTQFAGAASALGSTVTLNRQGFRVIGVSAPGFSGIEVGRQFDVAVPLCATAAFDKRNLESRGRWWLTIVGRVKPGLTPETLQSRLDILAPNIMRAAAATTDAADPFLQTRLTAGSAAAGLSALRRTFATPLRILMAGVAIVLLLACANIAGLTLARATARGKEMAVRAALGASRRRLLRQLITESVLLGAIGGALALVVAKVGADLLVRNLSTGRTPLFVDIPIDLRMLAFTAGVALITGLLVGLVPALRASRGAAIATLKIRQTTGGERHARFFAGRSIVAGQVALSLILLIAGGLLLRTFTNLVTLDAGFDRDDVLLVTSRPAWFAADTVTTSPEQRRLTLEEAERRLRAVPGVVSAARAFTTPMGDDNWIAPIIVDTPDPPTGSAATTAFNFVTAGYFATLRTPLVAGRDFEERDAQGGPAVAIVNESLARRFFPGIDPLGQRFRGTEIPSFEIVGVVKDAKYGGLREVTPPTAFLPAVHAPGGNEAQVFLIRTATSSAALLPSIQGALVDVSRQMPLRFQPFVDQIGDNVARERLLATLAAFFGGLALLLAMVGLYGLLNYFVTQQQVEFGIRMALGAAPVSILRYVLRGVAVVVGSGLAVGLVGALVTVNLLEGLLFGLEPRDTATIAGAIGLLAAFGLLAAYLPARRAMRVDPVIAFRSE